MLSSPWSCCLFSHPEDLRSTPRRMKCKASQGYKRKKEKTEKGNAQPYISDFRLRRRLFCPLSEVRSLCWCDEETGFLCAAATVGCPWACALWAYLCCLQRLPCLPLFQDKWGSLPTPIDPAYYNSCGPAPTSLLLSFSISPPPLLPATIPASPPVLLLNINPTAAGLSHKAKERGIVFQKRPYHIVEEATSQRGYPTTHLNWQELCTDPFSVLERKQALR